MSSRTLRILAVLLAIGSVMAGFFGYRLSQQPGMEQPMREDTAVLPPDTHPVVVAVREIPPGTAIQPEDVSLVPLPVRPEGSFTATTDLVGKSPSLAIAAGEPPVQKHFLPGSSLSRAIRPGERAIAVKVDEVIGSGGLVQPGDYVDVLLYLRGGSQELPRSSAQLVLRHARVLAYGETMIGAASSEGARDAGGRSAVLAVPLEESASLMLAASAGTLRLAVYGAEEGQAVAAGHYQVPVEAAPITLSELAHQRRSERTEPAAAKISVFHGARKEVIEAR
jgi:pilus assembly protein CpaB